MLTATSSKVELVVDTVPSSSGSVSTVLCRLGPDIAAMVAASEGDRYTALLRVNVVRSWQDTGIDLPEVAGQCELDAAGLRFTPLLPFETGVAYRVHLDVRLPGSPPEVISETLEFTAPRVTAMATPEVVHVYPSSDVLPENLLRFYVSFSNPMRRGHCEHEVTLRDAEGRPVLDALYRAPVELWDGTMRHLTVLLDPGRLKRHLGPNAALGPPMQMGEEYELEIGAGMRDVEGKPMRDSFRKRFRTAAPVRTTVNLQEWQVKSPRVGSLEPLTLQFPGPLDWAMLLGSITVETAAGVPVQGRVGVSCSEMQAEFSPISTWLAGSYKVSVATSLEDVCGNDLLAPFDRPYRQEETLATDVPFRTIPFSI